MNSDSYIFYEIFIITWLYNMRGGVDVSVSSLSAQFDIHLIKYLNPCV